MREMVMAGSRVRYLEQGEKQATRPMYEAAFPEDSREFVDYYYKWKIKDNEIIVMEGAEDNSSFHVMIHLNPHTLCINGNTRAIPYIVAVATDSHYRRQGKMRQAMQYALQMIARKGIPFTFLLPADPAYYRGQGFVYFPSQDYIDRGGICIAKESLDKINDTAKWQHAHTRDSASMAAFANQVLEKRCGIYIKRDIDYYHRLSEELGAEKGDILVLKTNRKVQGIIPYSISCTDGAVTAEMKEILLENDVTEKEAEQICQNALNEMGCKVDRVKFTSSRMMVRLTNLFQLVPLLKSRTLIRLSVKVTDSIVDANNGNFRIEIDSDGGNIRRVEETETEKQMDIAELTEVLFRDTSVYLHEWV